MIRSSPRGECFMPLRVPTPRRSTRRFRSSTIVNRPGRSGNRLAVGRGQVQERPGTAVTADSTHDRATRRLVEVVEQVPGENRVEADMVLEHGRALDGPFNVAFLLRHQHFGVFGQGPRYVPDVEHAGELREVFDVRPARRTEVENVRTLASGDMPRQQLEPRRLEHPLRSRRVRRLANRRPGNGAPRRTGSISSSSRDHRPRMHRA